MDGQSRERARRTRRDGGHAAGRPTPRKVKRTIVLTPEASARLDVHALGVRLDVSQVIEALILANCRRFVLTDRGGGGPQSSPGGIGEGQG